MFSAKIFLVCSVCFLVTIIHAEADDYKSDPAGNAGPRVACGVVVMTKSD